MNEAQATGPIDPLIDRSIAAALLHILEWAARHARPSPPSEEGIRGTSERSAVDSCRGTSVIPGPRPFRSFTQSLASHQKSSRNSTLVVGGCQQDFWSCKNVLNLATRDGITASRPGFPRPLSLHYSTLLSPVVVLGVGGQVGFLLEAADRHSQAVRVHPPDSLPRSSYPKEPDRETPLGDPKMGRGGMQAKELNPGW